MAGFVFAFVGDSSLDEKKLFKAKTDGCKVKMSVLGLKLCQPSQYASQLRGD